MIRRLVLIGLIVAGCKSEPRVVRYGQDDPLVLDSMSRKAADVAAVVVDNPAPDTLVPSFRIAHEPLIRVGGRNDEALYQELWVVRDAVLTTDGRLVVSMDNGREVRVFDQQNRFTNTLGRTGDGPGEFRTASSLMSLPGDSVLLYDPGARRINVYGANGKFARWLRGRGSSVCCFPDGAFLTRVNDVFSETIANMREPWPAPRPMVEWAIVGGFTQLAPEHEGQRQVGQHVLTVAGDDRPARIPVQGFVEGFKGRIPPRSASVPFARTANVRIAGDRIVYGSGDRFEYQVYERDGTLVRTVRAAVTPVQVQSRDVASARSAFIAAPLETPMMVSMDRSGNRTYLEPKAIRKWYAKTFDALELPDTMPAYGRIRTEEDGSVWVSRYLPPGDSLARQWWARFDDQGRLLGTLHIPQKQTVVRFTRGHVILRYEDPRDGFHIVAVHRVIPQ